MVNTHLDYLKVREEVDKDGELTLDYGILIGLKLSMQSQIETSLL